ncbi:MAG: hypothetical protein V3R89_01555 [Thermoanaerobaculia bacterium]
MVLRLPIALAIAFLWLLGCGPSARQQELDRQAIQSDLEAYLPRLGEAYATGDLEVLREGAAIKEVARIEKRIQDLALQGRVLVPTFRQLTIEDVNVWNYANAYVTTLEIWDLKVLASGTDTVLSEENGQSSRVQYQLKRDKGRRWRVLFRSIQG